MCVAGEVLGCGSCREVTAKPSRCLWYFGSCLFLLFPHKGRVLCGYVVSDRVARPMCTVPVVDNLEVSFVCRGKI